MSADQPMAVVAPSTTSGPVTTASHAPEVEGQSSSDDDRPLAKGAKVNGGKRAPAASDSDLSSEDEKPLSKKPRMGNGGASGSSAPPKVKPEPSSPRRVKKTPSDSELSEDEKPLAANKAAPRKSNGSTKAKPKRKDDSDESSFGDDSEDEKPLAKKKPAAKPRASTSSVRKVKAEPDSDSEDEKPLAKKANGSASKPKAKVKEEKKPVVKKERKPKEEEEDDSYKWWEQQENDGSVKWNTLLHNGILFPPPYVPLPKSVKMKYEGQSLTLPPESEEVAGFFGAMLETDHAQDAKFRENFFRDFKEVVAKYPPKEGIKIKTLEKCDFKPMYEYFESEREKKKAMSREEKKALKEAKDEMEKPYVFATIDGRQEKCGNFRAEPPGLFRGRGEHPKKGTLKHRLRPEDITLNLSKDAPVPIPNVPGQWKGIQHDNTVTWLATWKENVNKQIKYVFLSAASTWKGQSDRSKFEKARELIKHIDQIRKDYETNLTSKVMADRQRATAMYFIDRLALRAGNEKGEEEADTVGCCSLRFEHVTLEPPNIIKFDFLGKDSMRFQQEVTVEPQVFKNVKLFKKEPKTIGDDLFDRLNTATLNKYLGSLMPGLSAKVFRTYNASWTFQEQLKNTPDDGTVAEKIAAYNTANRMVAILCNHQKTVSKGFDESFAKMGDKLRALKYQRLKLRLQMFTLDPKAKKRHPELADDESDIDEEFMERHESELLERALEAAKKKFDKDNIKLEDQQESKMPKSDLDEKLKTIKAEFKELKKERKSRQVEPRKGATEERLLEQIAKMDERIATFKVQMSDRNNLKDVALGTSKINYIDPRITCAWAKRYSVPLEKLFSKTLREKFPWAEAEADEDWVF